jgi:hypothetical protein
LKSENIKSLVRELNLGLENFVFIDDDPGKLPRGVDIPLAAVGGKRRAPHN